MAEDLGLGMLILYLMFLQYNGGGGFYQPPVEPKQEMEMLTEEAKALKEQLEAINKRISELKETEKK